MRAIRDADLLAEVEAARGSFLFATIANTILHRQRARDAEEAARGAVAGRRQAMGRDQRRRDAVREVIENEPTGPENLQHIHSVLALALPYRDPGDTREFFREYGRNSLSPARRAPQEPPPPARWSSRACPTAPRPASCSCTSATEAVRQRSPTVAVADSLSGFMKEMGFAVTGASAAPSGSSRSSWRALPPAPSRSASGTGRAAPAPSRAAVSRQLDLWLPQGADGVVWQKSVQFHQDFYDNLIQPPAGGYPGGAGLLGLGTQARPAVLGRLPLRALQRPLRLTWDNLHKQFGADNASLRSFRQALQGGSGPTSRRSFRSCRSASTTPACSSSSPRIPAPC